MNTKPQLNTVSPSQSPLQALDHSQEIDLLTLLDILWCVRKRILVIAFCFGFGGVAISLLLPQKWTSNAVVTPSERTQLLPLKTLAATMQVLGVENDLDSKVIFNLFIKKFSSPVLLEEYIKSSSGLMEYFAGGEPDPIELHRAILAISEKMKAVDDTHKMKGTISPYSSWSLSFTESKPEVAQQVLAGYIKFVSAEVVKQMLLMMRENLAMKVQVEKQHLDLERAQLENSKDTKIKRLHYSLEVAKAAGINKPVYSKGQTINDDPDFSVTLGTNGINKKLEIEESIKDVSMMNEDILNREYLLKKLEDLKIKSIQFPVINYQLMPSLPVKEEGPSKMLVMLLMTLIGGMGTCGAVLLQNARESRRLILLERQRP